VAPPSFNARMAELRKTGKDAETVRAAQLEHLNALVAHARANSKLYREHYAKVPERVTDVRQLPPVTRAQLQGNFDAWVSDPAVTKQAALAFASDMSLIGQPFLGKYALWTTSGVTGEPGIFLQDDDALEQYRAISGQRLLVGNLGMLGALRLRMKGPKLAVLYATGAHFGGIGSVHAYERTGGLDPELTRIIPVQLPVKDLVAQLNEFRPDFIMGYTNSLLQLAEEKRQGRLRIKPMFIMTCAEWYDQDAYRAMQQEFKPAVVRDVYGATECTMMAYACKENWLHVNADWCIVEPVELDYSPTPPGQVSRTTLITNLVNKLQPLIRYDIGDRTMLRPDACPCGSPFPAIRVEGRRDQVLTFLSPKGERVSIVPKAMVGQVEQVQSIELYQLLQTGPASMDVRIQATPGADADQAWEELRGKLGLFFAQQGLEVALHRSPEPPRKDPKTGKFLHIWATPEARAKVQAAK